MNRFIGIGRWSKEIELRYTPGGKAVANSTIAMNDRFGGDTTFLPVVMWGKTAENAAEYSGKGRQIAIEGRIQVRSYENNEGRKIWVTEAVAEHVQFLDKPDSKQGGGQREPFSDEGNPIDLSDDDLPF